MHNNGEQDKQECAAMTDENRIMFTLPNTGSTWFAGLLGRHIPGCKYYDKEFFNPVCNIKHSLTLINNFGSELACCYRNIATSGDENITDDIAATWGVEPYTFTKETYSAYKVASFANLFRCFVFLRREENSFPPRRARVWSFYEHAWQALKDAGHDLHEVSLYDKMIAAHRILESQLLRSAKAHNLPVIWWEELFADSHTIFLKLKEATGLNLQSAVEDIVKNRKVFNRGEA